MKLRIAGFLALAGLIALLPKPARADGVSFNFGGCTVAPVVCSGDVGSVTANYTSNGHTIIATAFSISNYDLFIKNGPTLPADEQGLGMVGTTDHEIQPGEFIQLNVTSLAQAGFTTASLILGSVQLGEGYQICVSNVAGSDSGHCFTGNLDLSPVTVNFGSGYNYIDVTATTGDVLIAKGLVATPEPSSLMLLGAGLLALVGLALRKVVA
jgi:PEP-CTERM motif